MVHYACNTALTAQVFFFHRKKRKKKKKRVKHKKKSLKSPDEAAWKRVVGEATA